MQLPLGFLRCFQNSAVLSAATKGALFCTTVLHCSATEQADVRHQVGTVQVNGGSSITEPSSNSSTAAVESDNQQQQQQQQPVQQQRQQTATSSSSGYYTDEADNATVQVRPEDIVTLNVGGRLFSCRRRTLCLVEESLLALMFGWVPCTCQPALFLVRCPTMIIFLSLE